MQRSVAVALLGLAILSVAPVRAQKGGPMFHGGGPGVFGHSFPGHGGRFCCPLNRPFPHLNGPLGFPGVFVTGPYYPFWYDEPLSQDQPNPQAPAALPNTVAVAAPDGKHLAEAAPSSPKLIDVPGASEKSAAAKPQPPVVFVLLKGERLEARRYTLTADFLFVDDNGQRRRLPVAALDREATIAANRQRGIELKFPADPNEISLGF